MQVTFKFDVPRPLYDANIGSIANADVLEAGLRIDTDKKQRLFEEFLQACEEQALEDVITKTNLERV